jgi:hypothetical protein
MTSKNKQDAGSEIQIVAVQQERVQFVVRGTSPLILNRLAEKARRELLMPAPPKNRVTKATTLKHDPYSEFRSSPYRISDPSSSTLIGMPSSAFKGALRGAALDQPNAKKTEIGRLSYVEGEFVAIYGTPELLLSVVRQAGMNRTPDIRARAILREWAAVVTISFIRPNLTATGIGNLLAAAGITQGVGDWRPEKGAGAYGQFTLTDASDPVVERLMATGGRTAQEAAMNDPSAYNEETLELLSWFDGETSQRGITLSSAVAV